jgi:oxalate decarboxylase/phosphoglucose isomerase-like protein (cupin superfamily)
MIDLQSCCSLSIKFDQRENVFYFSQEINYDNEKHVGLRELIPVLLNKSLVYPENVYTEYSRLKNSDHDALFCSGLTYDVVCLPPGLLGIEFIKSHVYYSQPTSVDDETSSDVIEVLYGVVTVILQKLEPKGPTDFDTNVSQGLILKARRGERVVIPKGWYYTFVNTRNVPAIFGRVHQNHHTLNYDALRREQGLAYYVIRKNARQEVVMNPRYRVIPKIQRTTADKLSHLVRMFGKTPLYAQVTQDPNKFREIL